MQRVLLVARDWAPSNAFVKLAGLLGKQEVYVESFLGHGKDILLKGGLDATAYAEHPCVVLTGMSSSEKLAREEIAALEVGSMSGNPVGCYSDAPGAFTRPWFAHLRDKLKFLFVLNEEEAETARRLFPNATVIASGNPTWDEWYEPKMPRADARAKLEVADGYKVMFCIAAGKFLPANVANLVNMISAASRLGMYAHKEWHIVYALHPGDEDFDGHFKIDKDHLKTTGEVRYVQIEDIYAPIRNYCRFPLTIMSKAMLKTTDALSAADIVIDSGSTSGTEAVARNLPVIEYMTELQWERIREQTGERRWPTVDQGCVPLTEEVGELANKIRSMLLFGEFERVFLPRQKECYPKPEKPGVALRAMADTICGTVLKS